MYHGIFHSHGERGPQGTTVDGPSQGRVWNVLEGLSARTMRAGG